MPDSHAYIHAFSTLNVNRANARSSPYKLLIFHTFRNCDTHVRAKNFSPPDIDFPASARGEKTLSAHACAGAEHIK
jgi:hypothetical protein